MENVENVENVDRSLRRRVIGTFRDYMFPRRRRARQQMNHENDMIEAAGLVIDRSPGTVGHLGGYRKKKHKSTKRKTMKRRLSKKRKLYKKRKTMKRRLSKKRKLSRRRR